MILLIDAGNTNLKWACSRESGAHLGEWDAGGTVARAQLAGLAADWEGRPLRRVLISNVAGPELRDELMQLLARLPGGDALQVEWFASVPSLGGVCNGYRTPQQLGCDRFASAIGARSLFPHQPLIVVTCGTATTVDAVSADGVFIGGMILPGLGLMAKALARDTAQLPQVAPQTAAFSGFADNTEDAIVSGCITAQAGAIEHAFALHGKRHPGRALQCILSGGAAPWIAPHLSLSCQRVDNLVLIGLQAVALAPLATT